MNLPSLPTDNLYKFQALAGLFLIVFGTVYPSRQISELELRRAATGTERSVLVIQVNALERDTAAAKKSVQSTESQVSRLAERLVELEIKQAQIIGKAAQEKILTEDVVFAWRTLRIGLLLGFFLSFTGFLCWYFRVQKPQDKLLQNQLAAKSDA